MSFEEFFEIDKASDQRFEYIDGQIFMLSSPSSEHQIVVMNLATEFGVYFRGKKCRPFVSPYDVFLRDEKQEEKNKVQPDLLVVCNENGIKKIFF